MQREFFISVILFMTCFILNPRSTFSQTEDKTDKGSVYFQALELVSKTQAEEIHKIEGDSRMDIKDHQWNVQRPFYPGNIDSTHMLTVVYRIDGKALGAWNVDLYKKTALMASAEQLQKYKDQAYSSVGDIKVIGQTLGSDNKE